MGWLLFALFTLVPLVEVTLLIQLGGVLGFWPTFAVVVATGAIGAFLAKAEGRKALARVRNAMATGQLPEEEVAHGALVLVGGTLLVTPGVVTDVVGLSLLFRPVRQAIIRVVFARLKAKMQRAAEEAIRQQAYAHAVDVGPARGRNHATDDVIDMSTSA